MARLIPELLIEANRLKKKFFQFMKLYSTKDSYIVQLIKV